ncbi:hypothetical protein CALCODRAFT_44873 [Calocera cornea HHB12733]|uniref:Uncharacterized protein n=1 Tax=Calocera cornea HHB12733 TaxID=1353952 RepID=A0A165IY54_9BASI|nr:hypothetical protein CALCODRAFT_44873 [Calocera cornea HHB12733]
MTREGTALVNRKSRESILESSSGTAFVVELVPHAHAPQSQVHTGAALIRSLNPQLGPLILTRRSGKLIDVDFRDCLHSCRPCFPDGLGLYLLCAVGSSVPVRYSDPWKQAHIQHSGRHSELSGLDSNARSAHSRVVKRSGNASGVLHLNLAELFAPSAHHSNSRPKTRSQSPIKTLRQKKRRFSTG